MKYLYWNNPKLNRKQLLLLSQKQGMAIIVSSLAKKIYVSRNNCGFISKKAACGTVKALWRNIKILIEKFKT
jgi:hypothetical protein